MKKIKTKILTFILGVLFLIKESIDRDLNYPFSGIIKELELKMNSLTDENKIKSFKESIDYLNNIDLRNYRCRKLLHFKSIRKK